MILYLKYIQTKDEGMKKLMYTAAAAVLGVIGVFVILSCGVQPVFRSPGKCGLRSARARR
jgi:hypothetical protein